MFKNIQLKKMVFGVFLQDVLLLGSGLLLTMCSHNLDEHKVYETKNSDTSHNILTGSDTVTNTTNTEYKNDKTGKISKQKSVKKTTYDENGDKTSETSSSDYENAR